MIHCALVLEIYFHTGNTQLWCVNYSTHSGRLTQVSMIVLLTISNALPFSPKPPDSLKLLSDCWHTKGLFTLWALMCVSRISDYFFCFCISNKYWAVRERLVLPVGWEFPSRWTQNPGTGTARLCPPSPSTGTGTDRLCLPVPEPVPVPTKNLKLVPEPVPVPTKI